MLQEKSAAGNPKWYCPYQLYYEEKDNDRVSFSGVSWKLRFLSGKLYDKISFKVKKGDIL